MQVVKIKASFLKNLPAMYKELGLIEGDRVDPSRVFFSQEDYRKLKKATAQKLKSGNPTLSGKSLENAVSMHLLNLGPSELLAKAIKPGYMLVV